MFATDPASHNHLLRSKRNRQTAGGDDSVKLPLTKKRRSALRRDTFEPLVDVSINEVAGRGKPEKHNGHAVEPKRSASPVRELTLRGPKKGDKRPERGGGLFTLSSNDFYTVSQLPCLPEQIRSHPDVPYSCVISPDHDYILALTHSDALIWPYNATATIPPARDLISFRLPFPSAAATDPLPLAAFTSKSANGEPGIVVVSPKLGKTIYWENIANTSSFVLDQAAGGVQGSVPGMLSGEVIEDLVNAEPAGFIITSNYGRVAHLTVKDQMGRPGIGLQFMRKAPASNVRGGLLGSIRNVFAVDRRKGTPIVKAGKSSKAQRNVLILTEDGDLESWTTNLGIGNSLLRSLSMKEELCSSLGNDTRILDFDVGFSNNKQEENDNISLLLLAASAQQIFVLESTITAEKVSIKSKHLIKCYTAPDSKWRPRLCLSKSQPFAFVVFETAIVLMSLAKMNETPSSQLIMEKDALPEQFQDSVRFQDDTTYRVLGFTLESLEKRTACVLAVQGFGIIRITLKAENHDENDLEDFETRITPKSKIEQAIFFGTSRHNPLDLYTTDGQDYSNEEIETATLEISGEILSSESKFIPKSAPSIDSQMKTRSKAMEDLAAYVLGYHSSAISRSTRFTLLANAEKLAAAQAVWKVQEAIQRTYPRKDDREMTYLNFALRALHETRQKYPDPGKGETDHVRHWLIHSVSGIGHLMSELSDCLRELEDMDTRNPRVVCDYYGEAIDLWNTTYRTAFNFREDNAGLYGLADEVFQNGVLQTQYPQNIPHPWTSGKEAMAFGQRLIYDACRFLDEWWDLNPEVNGKSKKGKKMPSDANGNLYQAPTKEAMHDLADRLPSEVELFSRSAREENVQVLARQKEEVMDPRELQKQATAVKNELRQRLVQSIRGISKFNIIGAVRLAENLRDPGLLVLLNEQHLMVLEMELLSSQDTSSKQRIERQKRQVQQHVETYFEEFGNGWAYAHFSHLIKNGHAGSVLAEAQTQNGSKQKYLTWFMDYSASQGQKIGRMSWINDVVGEQQFTRAQQTLEDIAQKDESDIWAQKTELCLAKLAGLAAAEGSHSESKLQSAKETARSYDEALVVLDIQDSVAQHVTSLVSDAIDNKAACDLSLQILGQHIVNKHPAFKKLLAQALRALTENHALPLVSLIDVLTLMDPVEYPGPPEHDPDVLGHEFAMALQCLDLTNSFSPAEKDVFRMMIWRRAMLRDDWALLNETSGKSDEEVVQIMQMSSLFRTLLEVYQHREQENAIAADNDTELDFRTFSPQDILLALSSSSLLQPWLKAAYADSLGFDVESGEAEKFFSQLEKDFSSEQDKLRKYVDKSRLGEHFGGLVKEAQRLVAEYTQSLQEQ